MDDLRGFASWVVLRPETGYLDLWFRRMLCWLMLLLMVVEVDRLLVLLVAVDFGCLGITKARVCFSSDRSCMRAEISGKSRFLLFSRSVLMSIEVFVFAVLKSNSGYCFLICAWSLALGPSGFEGVGFAGTSGGFSSLAAAAFAAGGVCFVSDIGSGIGGFRMAFRVSYGGGGGGGSRRILGVLSTEFSMLSSDRDRTNIDVELLETGRGLSGGGGGGS